MNQQRKHPPRIVAFTKDWDDVPTCTTHILREMGRSLPVLWVNSIGTRKPQLAHPSHLGRVLRRVASGFKRAELKENNLRVLSPILIPKAQSRIARWVNRKLFAWQADRELRDMGEGRIEYWCFVPNAVDLVPGVRSQGAVGPLSKLRFFMDTEPCCPAHSAGRTVRQSRSAAMRGTTVQRQGDSGLESGASGQGAGVRKQGVAAEESRRPSQPIHDSANARINESTNDRIIVYYCVDDWTQFHYLDTAWMAEKEKELLAVSDVVFAVSRYLESKLNDLKQSLDPSEIRNPKSEIRHTPHGVEYRKFRAAMDVNVPPADVAVFPKPLIGFYGNIYPWVDLALVRDLAQRRPDWTFVLIGAVFCDLGGLDRLDNVHLLGRREHDGLPGYCAAFNVAVIPYDMTQPRMASVNPVKTRELLAAGVPIVAADVPELRTFGRDVLIAKTVDEWVRAIECQLARTDRDAVSRTVAGDDWPARVRSLRLAVDSVTKANVVCPA